MKTSIYIAGLMATVARLAAADFWIYQVYEIDFYSSDGHTHSEPSPQGYRPGPANGIGASCPDEPTAQVSESNGMAQLADAPGNILYWPDGFCGGPAPISCEADENDSNLTCIGNGNVVVTCTPDTHANDLENCYEQGIDESYNWYPKWDCASTAYNC